MNNLVARTRSLPFAALAAAALSIATSAGATTYVASRAVGTGTLDFSMTTDGTIGVLAPADITDYSITLSNNGHRFTLTPGNSDVVIQGNAAAATATDLTFDFGGAGNSYFLVEKTPLFQPGSSFYCLETTGCNIGFVDQETIGPSGTDANRTSSTRSGIFAFATIAAGVPEPATWALMLSGFGLAGIAARRRSRTQALCA